MSKTPSSIPAQTGTGDLSEVSACTHWVNSSRRQNQVLKSRTALTLAEQDLNVIDRIEFTALHITSNAGLLLLLENTRKNWVFEWINRELVFGNEFTNMIKMNHIQTLLCSSFIGIDKLERLKLLQSDHLPVSFHLRSKNQKRSPDSWATSVTRPPKC